MNKEYLTSLDLIKSHFAKKGVISLQEFFEELPEMSSFESLYQPADFRYGKADVKLNQLTTDFLEHVTQRKLEEVNVFLFGHRCFDLRKFFEKEGVFFVINISDDESIEVGGDIFVVKKEEPLQLPPSTNTLTLIAVDKEDESFVTYVNHYIEDEHKTYIMGFLS
ncbi:MAG: hypothetical protein KC535_03830 [Nanoarchaeota archaeon]|nr:hypothetical protein [Nanoarchaeota archaeon]